MICSSLIRLPEIQIYSICLDNGRLSFSLVATIKGASHVRLLSGNMLGFAVFSGDDSFSYIVDWTKDMLPCSLAASEQKPDERWEYTTSTRQYHVRHLFF